MDSVADVLSPLELEQVAASLRTTPLEWVGNETWAQQMSAFEQINVQAALEATRGGEECVRDHLVETGKLPVLVHDLLVLEMWRQEVLPRLLEKGKPSSSFQIYMVMFNEANVCNILETILFGASSCEALGETVIDLVDYALRHLTALVAGDIQASTTKGNSLEQDLANWKPGDPLPDLPEESIEDELKRLREEVRFQIAMKCISVLRYLTDHMENLPLGLATRLTITHDVPLLMAQLLETKPWMMRDKVSGDWKIFEGSQWRNDEDDGMMPKLEGQVWIALYNLLSKKGSSDKYELHHHRISVLSKLAGHINDVNARQLPILDKLKDWLLKLSLAQPQAQAAKDLILIETVAQVHDTLLKCYRDRFDEIADSQKKTFLSDASSSGAWQAEAERLLTTLDTDAARHLLKEDRGSSSTKSCCHCHVSDAKHRCSRCKKARYCSRECQSADWPRHRARC